ncbi:hypothetical protein [Pyxidicoccus xibeiensis]|uniref:hypothetical protein n=1 Tax=Pyxidicoccus xibeiensis TaxID=2906759 RepID=UPI0020A7D472|nr:hypothetical protein [Pyxidicoccus xibeiensis]MCP3136575.1 hypothetical protein [Pyxidicoccus xibeiensis]
MQVDIQLVGLERLIRVCREHGFPARLEPAITQAPAVGEELLGGQLDLELAAFQTRFEKATLADLMVYSRGTEPDGILRVNEMMRRRGREPFPSCVLFAQVPGFAYYFGAVPALADARGVQPVLYIDNHDERCIVPVASSVDHLFGTYARFLETLEERPEYVPGEYSSATFPFAVPDLVAEDTALLRLLEAGRFDGLVSMDAESQDWLQRVLTPGRGAAPR